MTTAIVTKYLPAFNTLNNCVIGPNGPIYADFNRGSRIVASNDQGRVIVGYDYNAFNTLNNHRRALIEHTRKYGSTIPGQWVGQWLNADSMVWVYVTEDIKVEGRDLVG